MSDEDIQRYNDITTTDPTGGRIVKTSVSATVAGTVKIEDTAGNPLTSAAGSLNVNITGGGSGGPVTIADGADVTEGSTADAAATAGGAGTVSAKLRLATSQLNTLNTTVSTSALQTTGNASLASIDTKLTSPITVTGPLTDAQLRATPVPVSGTVTVTPSGTQAVNITQVAGVAIAQGHGVAATAIRVELPTDGTGTVGLNAGSNVIGHVIADSGSTTAVTGNVTVVQPTGTNLHTVIDSGTLTTVSTVTAVTAITNALPAGTNLLGKVGVDQTTPGTTNAVSLAQLGANTISTGNGASGTGVLRVAQVNDGTGVLATVTNVATIGTSVTPGTAATNLGKAEDAGHTTGDTGVMSLGVRNDALASFSGTTLDYTPIALEDTGRTIVAPHAPTGSIVKGNASATGTTSTSVLAAGAGSLKNYVTGIQVSNTGATTALITIQDGNGGTTLATTIAPAGGGSNINYDVPLVGTAATAVYFAAGSSSTTIYVSMQGYTKL